MGRKLIEAILEPGDLFGRVSPSDEQEPVFLELQRLERLVRSGES